MKPKKLIKELKKQLRRDPDNTIIRLKLAAAYREIGKNRDAVELYHSVAVAYRAAGRLAQAVAVCRSVLEIEPAESETRALLAELEAKRAESEGPVGQGPRHRMLSPREVRASSPAVSDQPWVPSLAEAPPRPATGSPVRPSTPAARSNPAIPAARSNPAIPAARSSPAIPTAPSSPAIPTARPSTPMPAPGADPSDRRSRPSMSELSASASSLPAGRHSRPSHPVIADPAAASAASQPNPPAEQSPRAPSGGRTAERGEMRARPVTPHPEQRGDGRSASQPSRPEPPASPRAAEPVRVAAEPARALGDVVIDGQSASGGGRPHRPTWTLFSPTPLPEPLPLHELEDTGVVDIPEPLQSRMARVPVEPEGEPPREEDLPPVPAPDPETGVSVSIDIELMDELQDEDDEDDLAEPPVGPATDATASEIDAVVASLGEISDGTAAAGLAAGTAARAGAASDPDLEDDDPTRIAPMVMADYDAPAPDLGASDPAADPSLEMMADPQGDAATATAIAVEDDEVTVAVPALAIAEDEVTHVAPGMADTFAPAANTDTFGELVETREHVHTPSPHPDESAGGAGGEIRPQRAPTTTTTQLEPGDLVEASELDELDDADDALEAPPTAEHAAGGPDASGDRTSYPERKLPLAAVEIDDDATQALDLAELQAMAERLAASSGGDTADADEPGDDADGAEEERHLDSGDIEIEDLDADDRETRATIEIQLLPGGSAPRPAAAEDSGWIEEPTNPRSGQRPAASGEATATDTPSLPARGERRPSEPAQRQGEGSAWTERTRSDGVPDAIYDEVELSDSFEEQLQEAIHQPPREDADLVGPLSVFGPLPVAAMRELVARASIRRYAAREAIISEGAFGDACYVIISGRVRVLRRARRGEGEPVEVGQLGDGALFGELSLLAERRRTATVEAMQPCFVYEVPRALLHELSAAFPEVGARLELLYRGRMVARVLAETPFFRHLAAGERSALEARFESVKCESGRPIVTEGQPAGGLFVVLVGAVEISGRGEDGRPIRLAKLGEGGYFGEFSLGEGDVAAATVIAAGPAELAKLPRDAFRTVLVTNPAWPSGWQRATTASGRALEAQRVIAGITGIV